MTADMLSWTRQQIETRKALAESASPSPWAANAEHDEVLAVDGERVADGFALSSNQLRNTVDHIVFNDPRQIVSDCEADLAILDEHAPGQSGQPCEGHFIGWCAGCAEVCKTCPTDPYDATDAYPCPTVRRIASHYRHRPGYLPEWAPERITS